MCAYLDVPFHPARWCKSSEEEGRGGTAGPARRFRSGGFPSCLMAGLLPLYGAQPIRSEKSYTRHPLGGVLELSGVYDGSAESGGGGSIRAFLVAPP